MSTTRGHVATRRCAGCGRQAPVTELIRLHRGPAGEVSVDRERRMGGRGAHVCDDACLVEAVRRKALQRAFRAAIGPVPPSLDSKDR